jgi:hypothetical protein
MEETAMPIRPIHHGSNTEFMGTQLHHAAEGRRIRQRSVRPSTGRIKEVRRQYPRVDSTVNSTKRALPVSENAVKACDFRPFSQTAPGS